MSNYAIQLADGAIVDAEGQFWEAVPCRSDRSRVAFIAFKSKGEIDAFLASAEHEADFIGLVEVREMLDNHRVIEI